MAEAGQNLTISVERADLKRRLPSSRHTDGTFIKVNVLDLGEICIYLPVRQNIECVCVYVGDMKEKDGGEILEDGIKR